MALCFSVAVHAAVVGVCPSPQPDISGQSGEEQDIVVLGVIELAHAEQKKPEILDMEKEPNPPQRVLETPPPELTDEPELLCEDQVTMAQEKQPPEEDVPFHSEEQTIGKKVPTQGRIEDVRSRYLRSVMAKLEKAKKYPPFAYRRSVEGTAEIEFVIHADGHAAAVCLRKSSCSFALDSASKEMVTRASPFAPIPAEFQQQALTVRVPVAFRIEEAVSRTTQQKGGQRE